MSEIVISTENLHKFYGSRDQKVHALRGIDLSIEEGEIVGVMGPSGCGKTTLLNCLSGLDSFDEGNISIQGNTLTDLNDNQIEIVSEILLENNIEVAIISNSTDKNRDKLLNINKLEKGGLSGKPIEKISNTIINKYYKLDIR